MVDRQNNRRSRLQVDLGHGGRRLPRRDRLRRACRGLVGEKTQEIRVQGRRQRRSWAKQAAKTEAKTEAKSAAKQAEAAKTEANTGAKTVVVQEAGRHVAGVEEQAEYSEGEDEEEEEAGSSTASTSRATAAPAAAEARHTAVLVLGPETVAEETEEAEELGDSRAWLGHRSQDRARATRKASTTTSSAFAAKARRATLTPTSPGRVRRRRCTSLSGEGVRWSRAPRQRLFGKGW